LLRRDEGHYRRLFDRQSAGTTHTPDWRETAPIG